ncbi:MAG: hypothetical protein M3P98_00915 [bacterium]|nr:hypothetical protein [bacterium]
MSTGKIYNFSGLQKEKQDHRRPDAFFRAVRADSTYAEVRTAFRGVFNNPLIKTPEKIKVGVLKGDLRYGTVHNLQHESGRMAVITHPNFPISLEETMGLTYRDSIDLAARYVVAFGLLHRGFKRYRDKTGKNVSVSSARSTLQTKLWNKESILGPDCGITAVRTISYRAAGRIALIAGDTSLPRPGDGPFPDHIAGLYNPLSYSQTQHLYNIVDNSQTETSSGTIVKTSTL